MAIFTNPEDFTLDIITQAAQVNAADLGEVQRFLLRFAGLPEAEFSAAIAARILRVPSLPAEETAETAALLLTQSILKTLMETGGKITFGQKKRLQNLRLKIALDFQQDNQQYLEYLLENSVLYDLDENALVSPEETLSLPAERENGLLRVSLLLLDTLRDLLESGDYRSLKKCPQCGNPYYPNPSRPGQLFCSRRCSNRARNATIRQKRKITVRSMEFAVSSML